MSTSSIIIKISKKLNLLSVSSPGKHRVKRYYYFLYHDVRHKQNGFVAKQRQFRIILVFFCFLEFNFCQNIFRSIIIIKVKILFLNHYNFEYFLLVFSHAFFKIVVMQSMEKKMCEKCFKTIMTPCLKLLIIDLKEIIVYLVLYKGSCETGNFYNNNVL